METIIPSEKSLTIAQAKDKLYNELIEQRAEFIQKNIEGVATIFDFTNVIRSFVGLVSHTVYYIPESRNYHNNSLRDATINYLNHVSKARAVIDANTKQEGLDLMAAYITALQEESICPYK